MPCSKFTPMKNRLPALLLAAAVAIVALALAPAGAQRSRTNPQTDKRKGGKDTARREVPPMTLAFGNIATEGPVKKAAFDAATRTTGLHVTDSRGQGARVENFGMTFAERVMYEDSIGNPLPTTDYLTEFYEGSALPEDIATELRLRAKTGDTIFFERAKVRMPDGTPRKGQTLKFWIVP